MFFFHSKNLTLPYALIFDMKIYDSFNKLEDDDKDRL